MTLDQKQRREGLKRDHETWGHPYPLTQKPVSCLMVQPLQPELMGAPSTARLPHPCFLAKLGGSCFAPTIEWKQGPDLLSHSHV